MRDPVAIELFLDYHCPYSYRATAWLEDLGPQRVAVRHRLFALEQVNRDPTAESWRLWEQPLDYRHHREMPERRPLLPFLATAIVEVGEPPAVASAFRLGLYMAKHDFGRNLSDPGVVERVAAMAGVAEGRITTGLADPVTMELARRRIEDDWRHARAEYLIFGVPTLRIEGGRPFYLRLAGMVAVEDGPGLLDTLRGLEATPPGILEIKLPERASA